MKPSIQQQYEQRHAQAVEELRKAKQFVLFTFEQEPGTDIEGDMQFLLGGSDDFAAACADLLGRYLLAQMLFPGVRVNEDDGA